MPELVAKSAVQGQPEEKIEARTAMRRLACFTVVAAGVAALTVLVVAAADPPDKYLLKSPSGIAFSDFRGYEDWAVVSSAGKTPIEKFIVASPTLISAF